MAEVSNNLIAGLLIVAIVISGIGLLNIAGVYRVTGGAITDVGQANISITGQVAIELHPLRQAVDFDTGTLDGARRWLTSRSDNYGTFDDGGFGNGTVWGTCDGTEAACTFPLVVLNTGNINCTINVTLEKNGTEFIGGTGPEIWVMGEENESAACGDDFTIGGGSLEWGPWVNMTVTKENDFCTQFDFDPSRNEIRFHFNLSVPSDAVGTKGQIVTLGATAAT